MCTRGLSSGSSGVFERPCDTTRRADFCDAPACSRDPTATVSQGSFGMRQAGRDVHLDAQLLGKAHVIRAQAALNFLLQVLPEEAAAEHRGAALLHAAHAHADQIVRKHLPRAGAIGVAPHLVQNRETDLGQLRRTLQRRCPRERTLEQRPPQLLQEFGKVHSSPNSLAASITSRAIGAATRPP